jgi:5'-deoxynucleotidase YfbR-like HD superfamily hydrolase
MIQYHDIDEIITGDTIGYLKSEPAAEASERVDTGNGYSKITFTVQSTIQQYAREVTDEYEEQLSMEARFAKAIDKTEPIFHLYNEAAKLHIAVNRTTRGSA